MSSLKSKIVIFTIRNRHLFKGRLKPERITRQTSTEQLRREFEQGALKFGAVPENVQVSPAAIPGLPAGLKAEWIHPAGSAGTPGPGDKALFYTHGGGYVTGSCSDHRMHVAKFVRDSGVGGLLYEYRLAPEHPFPAGMDDTLAAYRWLLEQGVLPADILIVGESAGGGLCLASLLAIRDAGLPLPTAGVALSPWTDLTCSGESYRTNARRDISILGSWEIWSGYYAGKTDPRHPHISPVYGDLHGLPPILIEVGDHEILLDDACLFASRAKAAGVEVTLRVWEDMVHCFPLLAPAFPEASLAWEEIIALIRERLGAASIEVSLQAIDHVSGS